jgi:hypothetical protein
MGRGRGGERERRQKVKEKKSDRGIGSKKKDRCEPMVLQLVILKNKECLRSFWMVFFIYLF